MKPLRINLKRLPARAALIAVTIGAVSLASASFASSVTEKSNTVERPKIEKTLTPSTEAVSPMMMRSFRD